jgi:hypothetical protein
LFLVRGPRFRFRWDREILIPALAMKLPRVWVCNRRRCSNIDRSSLSSMVCIFLSKGVHDFDALFHWRFWALLSLVVSIY